MTKEEIEQIIRDNIKTNGRGEITARVMAGVLESFVAYTDSQADAFEGLCRALAAAFEVLVTELEGKFETKAEALEAAFEAFTTNLLENQFEPWAENLASVLTQLMRETKAAALDAKDAALLAKTAAEGASTASGQAKTAAETAATKSTQAKDAADTAATKSTEAKTAAEGAQTKATEAKTAAEGADTKAGEAKAAALDAKAESTLAKTAANGAKTAIENTSDGIAGALDAILLGNEAPYLSLSNNLTLAGAANFIQALAPVLSGTIAVASDAFDLLEADTTEYSYDGNTYTGIIALAEAKGWAVIDSNL